MAIVTGGKHFGQYTYEHWYDDEYESVYDAEPHSNSGGFMKIVLKNFRLVDEEKDAVGSLVIENGVISEVLYAEHPREDHAAMIIDGKKFPQQYRRDDFMAPGSLPLLMPAFVDLHAHFRDPVLYESRPGSPADLTLSRGAAPLVEAPLPSETVLPSEVTESAAMAAAAGGFGTVVCMANTKPVTDTFERAGAVKSRSDTLGLIDLYPVLSLSKGMEGKELSEISAAAPNDTGAAHAGGYIPLMLSEDGKDLADDSLFLAAMKEAKRLGLPVSCHCDFGGVEHEAIARVIALGKEAGCHIHIAHVSTKETIDVIRRAKAALSRESSGSSFTLSCEVMPHNLCLTEEDAVKLGKGSYGRVNPPLRTEEDRQALIQALTDGTIDAIATDHAPHSAAQKEAGAPGFSGFETAFAAVFTELVQSGNISLKRLSALMSANPARLLGLGGGAQQNPGQLRQPGQPGQSPQPRQTGQTGQKRGLLSPGYRADLAIIDVDASWIVYPAAFKSRGKNSPFTGRELCGRILLTIHNGRIVYSV